METWPHWTHSTHLESKPMMSLSIRTSILTGTSLGFHRPGTACLLFQAVTKYNISHLFFSNLTKYSLYYFSVIWDFHLSEYLTQREQCKLLTSVIYTSMVNTVPVSRDHLYFIFYKMALVKDYGFSAIIHIHFV